MQPESIRSAYYYKYEEPDTYCDTSFLLAFRFFYYSRQKGLLIHQTHLDVIAQVWPIVS